MSPQFTAIYLLNCSTGPSARNVGNNRHFGTINSALVRMEADAAHLDASNAVEPEEGGVPDKLHYGQQLQDDGCSNGGHPELLTVHGTSRGTSMGTKSRTLIQLSLSPQFKFLP